MEGGNKVTICFFLCQVIMYDYRILYRNYRITVIYDCISTNVPIIFMLNLSFYQVSNKWMTIFV